MSVLSNIVAKFRKASPNVAAAFDEVERRLVVVESKPAGSAGASVVPNGVDDTVALQAAFDSRQAVTLGPGIFKTTATLKLNEGQYVVGPGLGDFGCTIEFRGPSTANCFEMKAPNLSKVWVEGLRVQDRRVGATAGSAYSLQRAKNLVVVKRGAAMGFPEYGVSVWAEGGQDTECVHIEDMWFSTGAAGIYLQGLSNNVTIQHVMGDGLVGENTMKALIRLGFTLRGGAAFDIGGIKLETDNGCHVLEVLSTCRGAIHAAGLAMRGPNADGGGDIIRLQPLEAGETRSVVAQALASVRFNGDAKVCKAFINNGGTIVGDPSMRSVAHWTTG